MNLLYDYGIQDDESDYRIHVGFKVKALYFFPTENGKKAAKSGKYKVRYAFQPGIGSPTAEGFIIPWQEIEECKEILIPELVLVKTPCARRENTSSKGEKAVQVVKDMFILQLIPLPRSPLLTFEDIEDKESQIKGLDVTVKLNMKVQVKCDYNCGSTERGGTGNLYIQTKECNPFGAT